MVWYSPGSRAISTLAPDSAHPSDRRQMPEPAPLPPWRAPSRPAQPEDPNGSHTDSRSLAHESSHTQEFVRLRRPHRRRRGL